MLGSKEYLKLIREEGMVTGMMDEDRFLGEVEIEKLAYHEQVGPSSFDLRMDGRIKVLKGTSEAVSLFGQEKECAFEEVEIGYGDEFTMDPGACALVSTMERVKLPRFVTGQVSGRSSIGRKFLLVHVTAGYIDPGFEGQITLELANLSSRPLKLMKGARICQLSFIKTSDPVLDYGQRQNSKYQGSDGAVISRAEQDLFRLIRHTTE